MQARTGFLKALSGLLLAALLILGGSGMTRAEAPTEPLAQATIPSATAPGQINLPTATATVPGGPTPTPSRTPTLIPVLVEIVNTPVNLRSGPGLDFEIVGTLEEAGTTLPLIGRTLVVPWYLVEYPDAPGGQAWVFEQLVAVRGDITVVPIVEPPAPPTLDPTIQSIQATATILLQTPGAVETATAQAGMIPTGIYTITPASAQGGDLPTFTPGPLIQQPGEVAPLRQPPANNSPIPAGALIITLGALGFIALGLGLVRRL